MKSSFGNVICQILAKIEMTRNKNRLFGRHFEPIEQFIFFTELWFLIVLTLYGANFIANFRWEGGFLAYEFLRGTQATMSPRRTE